MRQVALGQAVANPELLQVVEALVDVVDAQGPLVGLCGQHILLAAHIGLAEAHERIDQARATGSPPASPAGRWLPESFPARPGDRRCAAGPWRGWSAGWRVRRCPDRGAARVRVTHLLAGGDGLRIAAFGHQPLVALLCGGKLRCWRRPGADALSATGADRGRGEAVQRIVGGRAWAGKVAEIAMLLPLAATLWQPPVSRFIEVSVMWLRKKSLEMPTAGTALPGRSTAMPVPDRHFVNGHPLQAPFPPHLRQAVFGLGCFWGAERKFWQVPGRLLHGGGLCRGPDARTRPTKKCAAVRRAITRWCW